ncbi:MAG: phosphate ABC transporter permease subunit PstC [Planctomycetota bacterium]
MGTSRRGLEPIVGWLLAACAAVSVMTTVGIVLMLLVESMQFFGEVSLVEFLFGTEWAPQGKPQRFGILPLLSGTLLVTGGAILIAAPLGLGTAIYLSEYASRATREVLKPLLEVLAGIPSVVYGVIAVTTVSPAIRYLFPKLTKAERIDRYGDYAEMAKLFEADVFNGLSASIVVAFMVLPTIVSLSEDVLRSVPRELRSAAFALGATKYDVTTKVVVPAALSGIVASFLLAISRAVGETMAVTLAAGATPNMTLNPLESVQTMTAYIVQVSKGDTPTGSIEYRTIFAVGLALFVSTMLLNLLAQGVLGRMREKYE